MTPLYNEIKAYLLSLGFTAEGVNDTCFSIKVQIPGREMIVNGKHVVEQSKTADFIIIPLGKGAELDMDNNPIKELQGYSIGDNDFWVDSLDDFKFWIEQILQVIGITPKNK